MSKLLTVAVAAAVLVCPSPFVEASQTPGSRAGATKPPQVPPTEGPDFLEIVNGSTRTRISLADIKKAKSGTIIRNGATVEFTPLAAVIKLARIPAASQIRVSGTATNSQGGREMILRDGSTYEPADFGFIFNRRGRPVLTPRPGTKHAAPPVEADRPQVVDVLSITVVSK